MATIALDIPGIAGECKIAGYQNKVDALGIADLIVRIPHSLKNTTSATVKHSSIIVKRYRDAASPLIAQACSSVKQFDAVNLYMFRTLETGLVRYMHYEMTGVNLMHLHYETEDSMGTAFAPHFLSDADEVQAGSCGVSEQVQMVPKSDRATLNRRPIVQAANARLFMNFGEGQVEWFSLWPRTVTWTYTQYLNGNDVGSSSKSWNILAGTDDLTTV